MEERHKETFQQWFYVHVSQRHSTGDEHISNQLLSLAYSPDRRVHRYTGYLVNGWRFNVKKRDKILKSQNSGVLVKGDESTGHIDYFGVLTDIIELNYTGDNNVILFKCDWWDVYHKDKGIKEDIYGFTMINVNKRMQTDEPYVLANQCEQVYYVKDTKDSNWQVVVKTKPRDFYDIPFSENDDEPCQENESIGNILLSPSVDDGDVVLTSNMSDFDGTSVDASTETSPNIFCVEKADEDIEDGDIEDEDIEDEEIGLTSDDGDDTATINYDSIDSD